MAASSLKRLRRSLARASVQNTRGSTCDSSTAGSGGGGGGTVERQPDGLPRLAEGLDYHAHFEADAHCPVCSLEEGEAHEPGRPSHAAFYVAQPPPPPPLRSIDEHGLALMMSLQRPRKKPAWWGRQYAALQARCAEVLESTGVHYAVIALTLLDLMIVVTELILSSFFPIHEEAPHAVHIAEEVLSWSSIAILSAFVAELAAKLAVFGHSYFTSSWWHTADALVVITSLTLELTLKGIAQEVASLLIFFRLWRVLRVMHGVAEAMELNHESEQEHHHRLIHGLQQDLAAEHRRVRQLEREVAALSGAAAGAGVDVSSILRLAAAAASQPDLMLLQAEAMDAAAKQAAGLAAAGGMAGIEGAAAAPAAAAWGGMQAPDGSRRSGSPPLEEV